MADARETAFQDDIVAALDASGWLVGEGQHYDRERALYPQDAIAFFRQACPQQWERFCQVYPQTPEQKLLDGIAKQLNKHGVLALLRHGYKDRGAAVQLCQFQPDHAMNPDALAQYRCNRLRVVPELAYSPHANSSYGYNPRLDLALFVNGLPTATLELKSEFKQSVSDAIRQYKQDRPVKAPKVRKEEPLLKFNRGALVHFAVSQQEVWMTTALNGKDTTFLPFNRGTAEGGAGNPPNPNGYDTAYLWEKVLAPDAWLRVLGRFLHLQTETREDASGQLERQQKLIFPRYHQLEAVNRLVAATQQEGPGQRYLIQHSAGSGKSNSIAWVAHQLSSLYTGDGQKLFASVIVVTDRNVLDQQLQDKIYQFEHQHGVVQRIRREEGTGSKSEQLAQALAAGTRIIVVTIQTFPYALKLVRERAHLRERSFAVIADEAHASQSGATAHQLKAVLGAEPSEGEEAPSAEELMDAAVAHRKPSERISYYAFTATPKGKTLELFGRLPHPNAEPSADNKPQPFHAYTMRQAIEEGFILDVLQNFISYQTAYRLTYQGRDDPEVETRRAANQIAKWVSRHWHNIEQRVQVIVEHFRQHVAWQLNGQAKAMVVARSRQAAVRYKLALEDYVREQGYDDVRALVAFSGSVQDDNLPEEVTETSERMNPGLQGRDLRDAFDTSAYNIMLVANKFQTGFDQPKLCALYVDKTLKGVDCVQTLSRLNRPFPGKADPIVLDFVNDPEDVRAAFEPYYHVAELEAVSDPDQVYELFEKLNAEGIYQWTEVEQFARAFFDPNSSQNELLKACRPAVDRWRRRYRDTQGRIQALTQQQQQAQANGDRQGEQRTQHALEQAQQERSTLDQFKRDLASFPRAYDFLSQLVAYQDRELEQLNVYARHLSQLLPTERLEQEAIDPSALGLTHYRLNKQQERALKLGEQQGTYQLKPVTELGSGQARVPQKEKLADLIERLNELFGADTTDSDKLQWFETLKRKVTENQGVMEQIQANPREQIMHGDYPQAVENAVLDSLNAHSKLADRFLDDSQLQQQVMQLLLDRILQEQQPTQS